MQGNTPSKRRCMTTKPKKWSPGSVDRLLDAPPGSPFGPQSARIGYGQLLVVPETASKAPLLDIHGDNATLSLVVWMKADSRFQNASGPSSNFGHLAGIWSEPYQARRYVTKDFKGVDVLTSVVAKAIRIKIQRSSVQIHSSTWWLGKLDNGSRSLVTLLQE